MPSVVVPGFPCHTCGIVLYNSLRLVAHSVKHTRIKPFFCPSCPRNFTRRERLLEHISSFHQEQSQSGETVRRIRRKSATNSGKKDEEEEDEECDDE